ncbi:restriction endonuclease subunit S [uncultured Thiodictyon sp.]|uniref:restriction endonuclease subunit S n=1 Tax=uncultured Thiodictyon sp. TaxID=1846217 RepID=UPI0025D2426F|nr:restriction endonuclease subunit S [uncultured Thiodictyon sp.]
MVVTLQSVVPRFVAWVFLSKYVVESQFEIARSRAAQPHLNAEDLASAILTLPSISEQEEIADFLDAKTAKIDVLIAKKRELIGQLKEKRAALIAHAVTRGLPPDAAAAAGFDRDPPRKPSGIQWLGDIPDHWGLAPLCYLVKFRGGSTPSKDNPEFWDGETPWVSAKDMKVWEIGDSIDHVSEEALRETSLTVLPHDSVLIVVRGMILIHTFPVARTTANVTINQDMKALLAGPRILPAFLQFALSGFSKVFISLTDESAHGTRKIEQAVLARFMLAIPPIREQEAIVNYLELERERTDLLLSKVMVIVAQLSEYRSSLITAAVTGKIDVRGWREASNRASPEVVAMGFAALYPSYPGQPHGTRS